MELIGYARVSLDCDVDDYVDAPAQRDAMEAWARSHRHRVLEVVVEQGEVADAALSNRLALAGALAAIRDRQVQGLVVARLERLTPDLIAQELVRIEVRRVGGELFTAAAGEHGLLENECDEPERALVRRTLIAAGSFDGEMRELRVRHRVAKSPVPADRENASLARIEQLSDMGTGEREIAQILSAEGFSPRYSHIFDIARLRKLIARRRGTRPEQP